MSLLTRAHIARSQRSRYWLNKLVASLKARRHWINCLSRVNSRDLKRHLVVSLKPNVVYNHINEPARI